MKKIIKSIFVVAFLSLTWGCQDFFITDPDDIINSDDYIKAQSEMYTGFYGIVSKMQAMADQAILLTDPRANFIEATTSAPQELQNIYAYADTRNNMFADPSGYYALVIACNDYLHKMAQYKLKVGDALDDSAESNRKGLVSSAIRIKAWTYMRLAQIYGKAVWFSDPMTEMKDFKGDGFVACNDVHSVIDKCLELLDNGENIEGITGINGTIKMDWLGYLDPETAASSSTFRYWSYVTPDWLLLRCELLLWSGNPDYDWIRNNILNYLGSVFLTSVDYMMNASMSSQYEKNVFKDRFNTYETVSSVMYDYTQHQQHNLSSYFSNKAPNVFSLRPSTYGMSHYQEGDKRRAFLCNVSGGDTLMAKYMYNSSDRYTYKSDASIPMQRGHDYHFFLSEAENALGHWDEAASILNEGMESRWKIGTVDSSLAGAAWDYRYQIWRNNAAGNRGFNNVGICGFKGAAYRPYARIDGDDVIYVCEYKGLNGARTDITSDREDIMQKLQRDRIPYKVADDARIILLNEAARQKFFDLQLLDEMILEYVGEGRAYGMMIRMAMKYNDLDIIANRVVPKYPASMQDQVRASILSGHYFIDWTL